MNPGEHTAKSLATATNIDDRRVRDHLEALLPLGLVEQISEGRGRIPAKWKIPEGIELRDPDDEFLPSVEAVCGVSEEGLELSEMPANWASADICQVPF
jgi:hypothetical protein